MHSIVAISKEKADDGKNWEGAGKMDVATKEEAEEKKNREKRRM